VFNACGFGTRPSLLSETLRTVVCEVLPDVRAARIVDWPSSSSEESGSSRAVVKDSVLEPAAVVLRELAIRSPIVGRRALGRLSGCGGVTSGVGGLLCSGGVAGAFAVELFGVCKG
jgi:hypothetical protein